MQNSTRQKFNRLQARVAALSGVASAAVSFNVAPNVEQTVERRIRESSEFLTMINMMPVINGEGVVMGLDSGPIAGRTNTANNQRIHPVDPSSNPEKIKYVCAKTDYNWKRDYVQIDAWRHLPEFEVTVRDAIIDQQGLDRIMIGFNGTSIASSSDFEANPLLQDVNIGWLHKIRTQAPEQVIDDGSLTVFSDGTDNPAVKAIYVKAGVELEDESADNAVTAKADYASLDALVRNARINIHERYRNSTELVVIVGHDLMDFRDFSIAQTSGATAEQVEATNRILASSKSIGGLPAYAVSFFPANAILITTMANLSIYYQEGTRRRRLVDEPEYERVVNYESVKEAFVVEEYVLTSLVENIVMGEAPARPDPA